VKAIHNGEINTTNINISDTLKTLKSFAKRQEDVINYIKQKRTNDNGNAIENCDKTQNSWKMKE